MRSPHVHALHRELTDANRPIRLRLSFEDGPLAARLLVKHVKGQASICGGLEYRLPCVASQAGLLLKRLVAMAAELQFVTHHGGIRAIAHHGKFLLQSQHDDTEVNAARNVEVTATDGRIVLMAKEIQFIAEDGSFVKVGGGIALGTKGDIRHQAANYPFDVPAATAAP